MIGDILGKVVTGYIYAMMLLLVVLAVIGVGLTLYQFEWSNIGFDGPLFGGGGGCNGDTDCAEYRQEQYLNGRP